ncbi:hypothetical protein BHE74_00021603 [Ensete ventricosum]|nr:hypothetical protein BHE74_00021603 [Ensete ventricosum]
MATSEVVLEEYAEELRIREGGGGRDTLPPQGRSGDLQRVPRAFDRRSGDVLRLLHHRTVEKAKACFVRLHRMWGTGGALKGMEQGQQNQLSKWLI